MLTRIFLKNSKHRSLRLCSNKACFPSVFSFGIIMEQTEDRRRKRSWNEGRGTGMGLISSVTFVRCRRKCLRGSHCSVNYSNARPTISSSSMWKWDENREESKDSSSCTWCIRLSPTSFIVVIRESRETDLFLRVSFQRVEYNIKLVYDIINMLFTRALLLRSTAL